MIREIRATRKNGEEFDCEIAISEVGVPAGSSPLFTVVIRDITERKRAEEAQAEAQASAARIEQLEREFHSLEQLTILPKTATTAGVFGLKPLCQAMPGRFNQMVERYGALIELALEQRAYKVDHDISGKLRTIAEQIGYLKAGPRDVVEIHSSALRKKTSTANPAKAEAYASEGRVMVLELMGHLVSHYRTYSIGTEAVKTSNKPVRRQAMTKGGKQ